MPPPSGFAINKTYGDIVYILDEVWDTLTSQDQNMQFPEQVCYLIAIGVDPQNYNHLTCKSFLVADIA